MPMLRVETILKFIKDCEKLKKPSFGVFEVNNYFMSNLNKPYNFNKSIKTINTKYVTKAKQFAHCFYFLKKSIIKKQDGFGIGIN